MRGLLSSMMLFVVVLFALTNAKPADDKYTTKYDNIDIDEILNSERLLKNYFNCVMDKGPCTPDGQELRNTIVDALETDCSKCSAKQNEGGRKVVKFLYNNKRDLFDQLKDKYDPEEKYINKYREELN